MGANADVRSKPALCMHTAQSLARYRVWMMDTADWQVTRGCAWLNNMNKKNPRISAPLFYQRFKCPDVHLCRERGEQKCPTIAATATLRPAVEVTETIGAFLMLYKSLSWALRHDWGPKKYGSKLSVRKLSLKKSKHCLKELTLKEISSCSTNDTQD